MTGFPWCKNLWTFYLFSRFYCVNSFVLFVSSHTWVLQEQWLIQGRGWGAQAPLVLNQTEAQRGTFLGLRVYQRVGILLAEVYKRVGKSVIWVCERAETDEFYGFIKSRKRSIFVIDSYLNDNAFTAVKRDAKF